MTSPSMQKAKSADWTSPDGSVRLLHGDCLDVMAGMEEDSVDAVVTDPPYGLEFMGKEWDKLLVKDRHANYPSCRNSHGPNAYVAGAIGQQWHQRWAEAALRVLKPGGHLVAFGGTRTHHRLWCALEDAGFEIRDTLCWLYGSGFPKSLDVSKAIDKAAGAEREVVGIKPGHQEFASRSTRGHLNHPRGNEGWQRPWQENDDAGRYHEATAPATDAARQWDGWGTALKPAWEPIVLARKPLVGTVAANILAHGTGALNIDATRIGIDSTDNIHAKNPHTDGTIGAKGIYGEGVPTRYCVPTGRWPANVVLDEGAAAMLDAQSGELPSGHFPGHQNVGPNYHGGWSNDIAPERWLNSGGASRFFFVAGWQPGELLLCRAKAIMEAWNSDLANTADDSSSLSNEHVVSALSDAVTLASRGEIRLSDCQGLSTNVTPSRLRRLCESAIVLTLSIEPGCLPASFPISMGPSSENPVKSAAQSGQTGTTTTTQSPTSSDGSAVVVTLATTPSNTAPGAKASPARFRYCAKASREERGKGNNHPTVKPLALMRWLVRLVTPPGGLILDPFVGSGTTALAAVAEGFRCIGIDSDEEYLKALAKRSTQIVMPLEAAP